MISISQLMRRNMGYLITIPKRCVGNSFYVTLPEMPNEHVPNIGLMPVLNKFPKFMDINALGCYFDMGKACIDYEDEIGSLINKIEESGNEMSLNDFLQELDKSKTYLCSIQGLLEVLSAVQQVDFSASLCKKISNRFMAALHFPFSNESLYKYFKHLETKKDQMTPIERRILATYLMTFELEGMKLDSMKREKLVLSNSRMNTFIKQYLLHLDIQNTAYSQDIQEKKTMEEFPAVIKSLMCDYDSDPSEGPWAFTMDPILIRNFFKYCSSPNLRSVCWSAMVSRATGYTNPKYKNSSNVEDIRGFRRLHSSMCGEQNYADFTLKHQMAGNSSNVLEVLHDVSANVRPAYEEELNSLIELANAGGQIKEFEPCDIPYWRRHQVQSLYGTSQHDILMYFPFEHVWSEALRWLSEMLGVTFKLVEVKDKALLWHKDVRLYEINESDGRSLGFFYLDPLMRKDKAFNLYGNFQFVSIRPGSEIGSVPLAAIIGGISYITAENEYLLSMDNMNDLFQMLGYLMQEVLTTSTYCDSYGVRGMERDVTSVSPYFFSNWLRNPEFLKKISKHCMTKEPLSDLLAKQLGEMKSHMAAHDLSQKMMISHIDILMYSTRQFWLDIVKDAWKHYQPLPYDPNNHFVCSHPSIVVGPLQSSYYMDFWSEMLAADLYTAFVDCPEADIPSLFKKYGDTMLRRKGETTTEMFRQFRGRNFDSTAISLINNIPCLNEV